MLVLSILEGLYIVYMFVFFKTKYSLEIGRWNDDLWRSKIIKEWFVHPIVKSEYAESQICPFGKYSSFLILLFLILRHYISCFRKINTYIFILILVLSLMNYNATLYLIPIFIIEFVIRPSEKIKNYLNKGLGLVFDRSGEVDSSSIDAMSENR